MLPTGRRVGPEKVLEEEFLKPKSMTQVELARRMGVPIQRVNTVVTGRRAISTQPAIRLARVLKTTPHFWMNPQTNYDLWQAARILKKAS